MDGARGIRAIARATGLDRNTVRGFIRLAEKSGLKIGAAATEEHLQIIRKGIGRPGAWSQSSEAEKRLQPYRQRIHAWLNVDRLLLTKIHELLGREGIVLSYAALYRFARKWCEFGRSSTTVRRQESASGQLAKVDFGRLGLFQGLGCSRPRMLWAFIMTTVRYAAGRSAKCIRIITSVSNKRFTRCRHVGLAARWLSVVIAHWCESTIVASLSKHIRARCRANTSTDYTDYPEQRAPFAMRWPDFYRKKAHELGEHAGTFTEKLFEGEFPWSRLRQAQKLLRLADVTVPSA
jgi:hypothetical protein